MRYFDISRLTKRATAHGPSGIDRVDLAYLQWLRSIGPVGYLTHGVAGCSVVDPQLGESFVEDLASAWSGRLVGLPEERMRGLSDRSMRLRAAGKWLRRRAGLAELSAVSDLRILCGPEFREKLELFDTAAGEVCYRADSSFRHGGAAGTYFGVSHAMLGRTAFLSMLARQAGLDRVFFIHDTIPCDFPQYCRALEGQRHLLRLRNAFRFGTHLVVNSRYTAERLDCWRQELGERQLPVAVLPIGVDEGLLGHARPEPAEDAGLAPYFVVLGTIEPRKNHRVLLEVWRRFAAELAAGEIPRLVVIGKRGWDNEEVFRQLGDPILKPHIEELNGLSDERLWPILRGARAMLFPSFVEGWGMPMIEALTLGVPVIASNIPAFAEAGQGMAELLDTTDAQLWGERVREYAKPASSVRATRLAKLKAFRPPTWREHFEALSDWLGPRFSGEGGDSRRHRD